jgi:hypothetical protein
MEKPSAAAEPQAPHLSESELAVTAEQPAQPQPQPQYAAQPPAEVGRQTLAMEEEEAPEIRAPDQSREPSAPVQAAVPTRPAVEANAGQPFTPPSASPAAAPVQMSPAPATQLVAQETSKTGLYVTITIVAIVIVIIIVMIL